MQNIFTFSQVAEKWKESKRGVVRHSTFCAYALILKVHLMPAFAYSSAISENEVQEFVLYKLKSGLSRKSVHDIVAVLKSIVRFGAKHSLFHPCVWDIAYPHSTDNRKLPVLSIVNHKKLLKALSESPTTQNIGVLISLCTGLRIGEVCALRWKQIDMVNRVLIVNATQGRIYNCETNATEHYISSPKTSNSYREIPISILLSEALRKVRKQQDNPEYVVGNGIKAKEPRTYREIFTRILKRLNIPPIVFHGLRHTFATRCIECGCDYKTVSAILGHSNVATTLNLYVHPNMDQKKRCIARMNKFLRIDSD